MIRQNWPASAVRLETVNADPHFIPTESAHLGDLIKVSYAHPGYDAFYTRFACAAGQEQQE